MMAAPVLKIHLCIVVKLQARLFCLRAPRSITLALLILAASYALCAQESMLAARGSAAHQALLDGRYDEAVKLYSDLVAQLPDNPGLRLNLGLALEKAGRPAEAIPQLELATRAQPELAGAWFLLGLAYQQLQRPQQAIAPLREAVRLDAANNKQALFELADAELTSGNYPHAARDFQKLADDRPDMAKAWQGTNAAYSRWSEQIVARIQQSASQSGYAKALTARTQFEKQNFGEALNLYRQAIQLLPSTPGLHEACAAIYRRTGHAKWAAIEEAREGQLPSRVCPGQSPACAYLKKSYKSILESHDEAVAMLYWQALAASQLASQSLEMLSRLPPSPAQHEVLAEAHQRKGQRLEAVEEWRRALALAPADRRLQGRLADSLYRARIYPEAEQRLTHLAGVEPGNSEWQYLLGSVLLEEEHSDAAVAPLEKALRLQPGFLPAEESLGRAYLNLGRAAEAISHLEKALPLDDGSLSFALSTAYRKTGRLDDARAALARYRQLEKAKVVSVHISQQMITPP
jgi:tetratricopeptide (TPR) repeat protein